VKDSVALSRWNPNPGVADRDHSLLIGDRDLERHPALWGEFDRVADQVEGYLPQSGAVAEHPWSLVRQVRLPCQAFLVGQLFADLGSHAQHIAQIKRLMQNAQLAGLAAGQIEHISNQARQMLRARINLHEVEFYGARKFRLFAQNHLAQAHDQTKRSPQLVTDH
jgi:hypothetical protein